MESHSSTNILSFIPKPSNAIAASAFFSGTFYEPHIYLEQIDEMFSDNELIKMFYHNLADYMTDRNEVSTEQAVVDVMDLMRLIMSEKQVIQLFRFAEPVDWLARMY